MNQCACYSNALLLAAREPVRIVVSTADQCNGFEQASESLPLFAGGGARQRQGQTDIVRDTQRGNQIEGLIDKADIAAAQARTFTVAERTHGATVELHITLGDGLKTTDQVEQG